MPKVKEINHPCHLLSLPSAKRFWCRHCMTVFGDAITRWRHSRSCRYGVVNNFMRRRELEAKALQNTSALNPFEARLEQSIQMCDLASSSATVEADATTEAQLMPGAESFNCFICHQRFASMDEMRTHVKYPCSTSKIITSCTPHPRHSVPVFIDTMSGQTSWQLPSQPLQNVHQPSFISADAQQPFSNQTSYEINIQPKQAIGSQFEDSSVVYDNNETATSDGITPTNIYVNEQGETVIEVENLDLNSEGGELSLAHLLTQLSQQGIVFDKSRSAELQAQHEITVSGDSSNTMYTTEVTYQQATSPSLDEEEGQPTAEDAANTLTQLAGFRSFNRVGQVESDSETQLISQVEAYCYSSSSTEGNKQTLINAPASIEIQYEYNSSNLVSVDDQSSTLQNMSVQQSMKSKSVEYVSVDNAAAEETIQYYRDSSNVAFVTNTSNNHHVAVHSDAISSLKDNKNDCTENEVESMLIQHYPVEVNSSGQIIITSTESSSPHHIDETQTEYIKSDEHVEENVEVIITDGAESSTFESGLNPDNSSQNTESCVIMLDNSVESQTIAISDEYKVQSLPMEEVENSDKPSS